MSCGISSRFRLLSPSVRQVAHALLTRPPLSSNFIGRSFIRKNSVRLACVRHAASVRPEPGSNSLSNCILTPLGVKTKKLDLTLSLTAWKVPFQTSKKSQGSVCSWCCLIYKVLPFGLPLKASRHVIKCLASKLKPSLPAGSSRFSVAALSGACLYYHTPSSFVNTFFHLFFGFFQTFSQAPHFVFFFFCITQQTGISPSIQKGQMTFQRSFPAI